MKRILFFLNEFFLSKTRINNPLCVADFMEYIKYKISIHDSPLLQLYPLVSDRSMK